MDHVWGLMSDNPVAAANLPAMKWWTQYEKRVEADGIDTKAFAKQGMGMRQAGFEILFEHPVRSYLPNRIEMRQRDDLSLAWAELEFLLDFMDPRTREIYSISPEYAKANMTQIAENAKKDLIDNAESMGYGTG